MSEARNVKSKVEGNKLLIEVDLDQNFGPSASGKTLTVASSGGFQKVAGDISLSINVCKKIAK